MQQIEVPDIPARYLVGWTLGVTAVAGCFWLLWRSQNVLLLLLTAIIVSIAIQPGVLWLEKRGLPKSLGILLIFGLIGVLLGLLIWFTLPVLAAQGTAMGQNLVDGYQSLRQSLLRLPNILVRRLLVGLPDDLPSFAGSGTDSALPSGEAAPGTGNAIQATSIFAGVLKLVIVSILTFYWTLESTRIKQTAFLLIPIAKRDNIRNLVQEIEAKMSSYLLGQGVLCLIIGAMAFIAYTLIGLPNALLLAVFAGLLEAVPIVGPFLGAVPAIIVGLSISPLTALWVILATAIVQQLENSLLVPRIMNRAIGIRPLVTILALLAFGSLFGVLGALVALPLAAVIQLLMDRFLLAPESLELEDSGRDRLSVLRYETNQLTQDLRNQLRRKEEMPSAATDAIEDSLEAIALDLETFLAEQAKD